MHATMCKSISCSHQGASFSPPKGVVGLHRSKAAARTGQLKTTAILTTIPRVPDRPASGSPGSLKVISKMASLASAQAQTQQFEEFAGRSAMIGFIVALAAELLTERSIFSSVAPSEAAAASGILLTAVALAAAAAAVSRKQQLGLDIKEAVITSLTAAQRSAASVTGKQVDRAVDHILKNVFDIGFIYSLLADDDNI